MIIREPPNIKDFDRRYSFTHIEWITSDSFENIVNNTEIHPNLTTIDQQKLYVGKALLKNPDRADKEVIGVVLKSLNGKWKLDIADEYSVHSIENNFLVLNIPDQNTFSWIKTNGFIPKHALRGSVEYGEFLYIGRVIANESKKPVGHLFDLSDMTLKSFNDSISAHFGKAYHCLHVPINNREVVFEEYDVLCLNPTPAPLKILSRLKVRELLGHDEERINKLKNVLPHHLFKFLQYPTCLYSGECLMPNEKLISECGEYEMKLTDKYFLIFKNRKTKLEKCTDDVQSIFLHFNHIVECYIDAAWCIKTDIVNDNLNPDEYKLKIIFEDGKLYFQVEMLDTNQEIKSISKFYLHAGLDRVSKNYIGDVNRRRCIIL